MPSTGYIVPNRVEVDGVPVFWLPKPGPTTATLVFRVGYVDEPLPLRGITHLVEHLALHFKSHESNWYQSNGHVARFETIFHVTGSPDEVKSFLAGVTSSLADLPAERIELEKTVLLAEERNHPRHSTKLIVSRRFGATGPGVEDYIEFGLRWLGPEAVARWCNERFNASNAAVWVSGALPDDLKLHLVAGKKFPVPDPPELNHRTPGYYTTGRRSVVLSMLNPRRIPWASDIVESAVAERMRRRLRLELGLAYETSVSTFRCGRGVTEIRAFADSLGDRAEQAAAELVAIARDLAQHGHRPDELESMLSRFRRAREQPDAGLESLWDAVAVELGTASRSASWDDYDREVQTITPEQVADFTDAALSTAILAIPEGVPCSIEGFDPLLAGNELGIIGTRVFTVPGVPSATVDYSDEGISLTDDKGVVSGIEWPDVVAAPWWNDGGRSLIGADGTELHIWPGNWQEHEGLLESIRTHVPAECWVPMGDPD